MATTRTAGITIDGIGRRTINKEYRGVRVFLRLGAVCQEDAERRLSRGSKPHHPNHDATGVPSPAAPRSTGTSKIASFGGCPTILPGWRCSLSTPACATTTCAGCNGLGRCLFPSSSAACSLCGRANSSRVARTWSSSTTPRGRPSRRNEASIRSGTNAREQARNEIAGLRSNKSASLAGILVGRRELMLHAAPSTRAGPAHRREHAGEVTLVRESAAECNLSQ